jgi:16S rRNA C967 or C1407 C5-methylase (RsmB/RsmF family)/NOL1/NOP2/fmu family ribosome biogenesis protein
MALLLPPSFLEQLKENLGAELDDFISALNSTSPISIRYNPAKAGALSKTASRVSWATDAYYLEERISFTSDPLFHAGAYYVQEASSMLIEQAFIKAFPTLKPQLVIDLCAAPGGKSTHLLSLMNQQGILISNEIHPQRNSILRQNLARWGFSNNIITQLPSAAFRKLEETVDLVLCDAPCSGEGLFRKDHNAIQEWSSDNVQVCAQRQSDLLERAGELVKAGGFLIYSTCTYNRFENDDQVQKLMNSEQWEVIDLELEFTGALKTKYGWQCYPHRVKGEGFYLTLLHKVSGESRSISSQKSKGQSEKFKLESELGIPVGYSPNRIGSLWHILPVEIAANMAALCDLLPVKSAGIPFGEAKGQDFIPAPELALSILELEDVPVIELNKEEALRFLRCDAVIRPERQRGWNLITYQNFRLGWVKVLQGRINNYFPKQWRILKELDRL